MRFASHTFPVLTQYEEMCAFLQPQRYGRFATFWPFPFHFSLSPQTDTHTHTPSTHINVSGMKSNVEYLDIFKAFYVEYISVLMCLMQMCQRSLFLKCTLKIEHLFVLLIL